MSDVILVSITATQPDLVTETGTIVYVPLASTHSPGIVTVGKGLLISPEGLLEFDRTEVTLKSLALNGKLLAPDVNKHINLVLTKNDVGLDKVDNTADEDKPVSLAARTELNKLDTKLTSNINSVNDVLVGHVNRVDNPHKVTKEQIGLGNVDNTSDANKPISRATKNELIRLERLIKGSDNIKSYASYDELVNEVNLLGDDKFEVGQSVYIKTLNVPDLWVYSVEEEPVEFEYTTDAEIENLLKTEGVFQVGYFKFAALETGKVNLDSYATLDTAQTITGDKNYTGLLKLNDKPVAIQEDVDYIAENYLPLTAGNTKHITGKLYVDNDIVLPNNVHYRSVTSDGKEITLFRLAASNSIMIGDSSGSYDMATYSLFRPVTGATNAALGSSQYKWNSIHGVEIYQNDKQVANKEDLDNYLPLSAGSSKRLTGPLYTNSGIILPNNTPLSSTKSDGTEISLLNLTQSGNVVINGNGSSNTLVAGNSFAPTSAYNGTMNLGINGTGQWNNAYIKTIYQNGKQVANKADLDNYLSLSAGSDKKLTGDLYITKKVISSATESMFTGQYVVSHNGVDVAQIGVNTAGQMAFQSDADHSASAANAQAGFTFRTGDTTRLKIFNDALRPEANNQYSLGTSTLQFNNICGKTIYQNGKQVADTEYVDQKISGLVDSAPSTLDTLGELASALKNNQDVVTTIENSIANKADKTALDSYLLKSGGNVTGHIYLTGAKSSSSTGNTSQIIFGTSNDQHLAISSNNNALVLNPTASETTNQIVLYLDKASLFPAGITTSSSVSAKTIYQDGKQVANKEYVDQSIASAITSALGGQY